MKQIGDRKESYPIISTEPDTCPLTGLITITSNSPESCLKYMRPWCLKKITISNCGGLEVERRIARVEMCTIHIFYNVHMCIVYDIFPVEQEIKR